jgi:hypothetical protein
MLNGSSYGSCLGDNGLFRSYGPSSQTFSSFLSSSFACSLTFSKASEYSSQESLS